MVHSHWQEETHPQILEKPKWWALTRPLHFGIAFGILVVIMLLGWYFWTPSSQTEEDIPVIKAAPGPTRIKPDSPGAPEIPHQDKMIYDELTAQKSRTPGSTLREAPEAPIDIAQTQPLPDPDDAFPIANTNPLSGDHLDVIEEEPRLQVVLAPKDGQEKKEIALAVPEVAQKREAKPHALRSLPLRKLFTMKDPSSSSGTTKPIRKHTKSILKPRTKPKGGPRRTSKSSSKSTATAKKKPFPILPIPKSMLYAKRKPMKKRRQQRT